jgi:eukaryotic-like serine/threonine-protein kinase
MTLVAGTKLGPYEVVTPLGAGGMGEVYRARDTKLNRDVALKVLPAAFAADPQRLARLQREAQVLASLNHPNIASIYGLEESGPTRALVMELVEGPTLAELLVGAGLVPAPGQPQGLPLHLDEALGIAKQIAEGLEYAHERNVIHRDLKPANVKVTPNGRVKILDFGLAKNLEEIMPPSDNGASPTVDLASTREGIIMGTPAYMSPEQARGRAIDKRSDIWAFGCVLFELLTGKQAFSGATSSDTIAWVLTSDPEWQRLPESLPFNLLTVVRRCLQKDVTRRLRDIGDARIEIEDAISGGPAGPAVGVNARAGSAAARMPGSDSPANISRFSIALSPNEHLLVRVGTSIAISPNGKQLVYVGARAGLTRLYLRYMDRLEAIPIAGTEGAEGPFFSPDGQWIGFFADHKLKKVALQGGTPLALCGAPVSLGASWGPHAKIVFASSPDAGLLQVSAAGGAPEVLTVSDSSHGESGHYFPEVLPDGRTVLYTVVMSTASPRIVALRLDRSESHLLIEGGTNPHYLAPGYLVYAWGPTLLAAPFDLESLRLTGPAVPVLQGVLGTVFAGSQFSLSRDGSLAYMPGELQAMERTMLWVNRNGVSEPLGAPSRPYMDPRVSPDGNEVVVTVHDGTKEDVWLYELTRGTMTRLTFEGFENETPLWTALGDKVVLSSSRVGPPMSVFSRPKDGSGSEELLFSSDHHLHLNSISPDGQFLVYTDYHPLRGGDLWLAEMAGRYDRRPLLQRPFNEWGAQFSPDGRWLAFVSNESGRDEIYVLSFPGLDRRWQISTDGGTEPLWARSGRELFYRHAEQVMVVAVITEPVFSAGKPIQLFEGSYDRGLTLGHTNYDVAPDARRFLMLKAGAKEAAPTQFNVVLNWSDELKRLACQ